MSDLVGNPEDRFSLDETHFKVISVTVKFLNFRTPVKHRCNIPKIQSKRLNLRVFPPKDANGIANSEDPDQTAPQGAV